MKCVFIAAGRGSRLAARGEPKTLHEINGRTISEHIIDAVGKAGITNVVIVIGYQGERIRRYLGNGQRFGVDIEYIENAEWQRGNGLSVLKASSIVADPFILTMSDHLFDPQTLKELTQAELKSDEAMLAVDYKIQDNPLINLDDVTRVWVEGERIMNIGKHLNPYNAFDTGLFYCTTALFDALRESIHNGDESLSGGVRQMVSGGRMKAFDITDKLWIDIDDEAALQKAQKLLMTLSHGQSSAIPAAVTLGDS